MEKIVARKVPRQKAFFCTRQSESINALAHPRILGGGVVVGQFAPT